MRLVLVILPWVWIGAGLIVLHLSKRARRQKAVQTLAVILAVYGVSDMFATTAAPPPWLLAWKAACILAAAGVLWSLRGSRG